MAFTEEELEYYHSRGLMPDWAYYQQSNKPISVKLEEQYQKLIERCKAQEEANMAAKEEQALIEKEVERQLQPTLEKALDKLLQGFKQ